MANGPTTKRRTKPADEFEQGDPFNQDDFGGDEGSEEVQQVGQFDPKALLDRINALEGSLERQRKTNLALMSQNPAQNFQPGPGPAPQLSYEGLPDPVTDPDGYGRAMAERNQRYLTELNQYQAAQQAPQNDLATKAERLWGDFRENYPAYTEEDKDRVDYVAGKVIRKMTSKGVDVNRYVFGASEDFFEDVDKEFQKMFGGKAPEKKRPVSEDTDDNFEDDGRTEGFPANRLSPFDKVKSRGETEPSVGEAFAQMAEWQHKTGFVH
jgi:hypothetical protein